MKVTLDKMNLVKLAENYSAGRKKEDVKALKSFTFKDIRGIIKKGETPTNLDNFDNGNRTQTAVQMTREMTMSNGCHVTLIFPRESHSGVRREIAEAIVTAMEKGTEES